ncbi:MAG TPA: hypothetical protein VK369_12085 [Segetibacter sp.]|nr:hypothetical protein [Segetibacter sp.]
MVYKTEKLMSEAAGDHYLQGFSLYASIKHCAACLFCLDCRQALWPVSTKDTLKDRF